MSLIQALKIFLLLLLIILIALTAFGILKCKNTSNETFSYSIQHDWKGIDLQPSKNKGWSFFSGPDPTNGFVNYGDHPELIKEIGDKIRIDVQHDINQGETRKSIRLNTKDTYNQGLFILSADHMPAGLAVWPAFWLTGSTNNIKKWACNGEIDIIENVNSDKSVPGSEFNQSTLHTSIVDGHSCLQTGVDGISNGGDCQSGKPEWMTCGCSGKEMCPTNGCGVTFKNPNSAGWGFNKNGGGVYACELTPNGKITIWFFEKDKIPKDIESNNPTPSEWPTDNVVKFKQCSGHFKELQVIINTTLCGDWAGGAFPCKDDNKNKCCKGAVDDKSYKMEEAYWIINYLKIFQPN